MYANISGNEGHWLYPLNTIETIRVAGPLGDTIVNINNGEIYISSSPCRNQLCVAASPVRKRGQWIACLPNQVISAIDNTNSGTDEDVDISTW